MRAFLVLMLLAFAGCTETVEDDRPADDVVEGRPDTTYGHVETGPPADPDWNATTEAAPRLVEGEWWRIRYDGVGVDELVEVVRIVANATDEGYIMGMPHEGWLKEAISFHSPSFGNVGLDLSYPVHNQRFEPVRFPLIEGDTWTTSFVAAEFEATVEEADEHEATIRLTPTANQDPEYPVYEALGLSNTDMVLTYDARQHEIVRMESGLGVWEVIEHGYDYQGWVTVPHGEDTAIDYGVVGPVSDSHDLRERTLEVEGDFNRMTMMHFVGTLGETPGDLMVRQVTPDGEEWITRSSGPAVIEFFETNQPVGTWTTQDNVVGVGFTYSMGIAYLQYDIRLPDGTQRTDHGHTVSR